MTTTPYGVRRSSFNRLDDVIRSLRSRHLQSFLLTTHTVLDFGCGQLNWFLTSNRTKIKRGVGIDPSLALEGDTDGVAGYRGTLEDYRAEHPEDRFDRILWIAVVEHFHRADALKYLRLCRLMLAEDGMVVLTTPTPRARPVLELLAFRLHVISRDEIADHKAYYSKDELLELLREAGFVVKSYQRFQWGLNSIASAQIDFSLD